jgi:hypothetical protein
MSAERAARGRYAPPRERPMKLKRTPEFLEEAARFGLRHHCEDCVLYDAERALGDRCAHGFPTTEHAKDPDATELVFCKDFEVA